MDHLDEYYKALDRIEVTGVSAERSVEVGRRASGEIWVSIARGSFRGRDEQQVAAEIRSAMHDAMRRHHEEYLRIRERMLGDWHVRAFEGRELTNDDRD